MLLEKTGKKILIFTTFIFLLAGVYLTSFKVHASEVIGTAVITADSLNVRSGPGKDYDAMGKLYAGNVADVTAVEGDWLKINYNNSVGYISIDYVEYEPDEDALLEEEEEENTVDETAAADTEETQEQAPYDYKKLFGLLGAILVLMVIILITIKSIKNMDDDDDDDDQEDDDNEDEYYDEDESDDEDYDDEEEYEDEEEEEEYEYVMVRRPKQTKNSVPPKKKSSDDFLIDIDPKYFE